MVPGYGRHSASDMPVDILFINLTNWPGNPVYPYAFVQLSALARKAGLSIRRWDGLGLSRAQQLSCITKLVRKHNPRVVAFTIRQADSTEADEYLGAKAEAAELWFPLEDIHAAIRQVRIISDARIVLGGFTFTVNPVTAAKYLEPDFGVIGEPDDFIAKFDQILAGRTEGVANLLYKQDGHWKKNQRVYFGPLGDTEYTPDIIDEIISFHGERPLREAHLAPVPGLNTAHDTGRAIAVEISRGCPFSCAFCCEPLVKGKKVRLRSLDVIETEIRNLLSHGLRYYWFVCSELNVSKSHVMALAERLIELNATLEQPVFWRAYFLPVKFNKDEMRVLLRSGLLLEHNGPFSDLSPETLKSLHEPYRVKHALAHIRDLMELNEEPEFSHRKMTRWTLWSWLINPYATKQSVRLTIETMAELGLDERYDFAFGYPALRVYECLSNLPEDVPDKTIILTGDKAHEPSIIHPSFYYSRELMAHFGGIDGLQGFLYYAQDTFLSKRYRMNRDWLRWAERQKEADLSYLINDSVSEKLPPWVYHPDLGRYDPALWYDTAKQSWQGDWAEFRKLVVKRDPQIANAMVATMLHHGFAQNWKRALPLFSAINLLDTDGTLLRSPFKAFTRLIAIFPNEAALHHSVKAQFSSKTTILLNYYLYALNLHLTPELAFLADAGTAQNAPSLAEIEKIAS